MGISIMGRGSVGSTIEPDSFIQRQRLADELYKNSIATPQSPELSWTQGASRLAQAVASGYERASLNKDREAYKEQRKADMQLLGNALANGDYKSVLGQLSDPESQKMAFGLAQDDNKERAQAKGNIQLAMLKRSLENKDSTEKFQQQLALKKADHALGRDNYLFERGDKLADKNDERSFDIKKMGVAHEYDRDKTGYSSELKKEVDLSDPVKATEQRLMNFARVVNDPNAPAGLREVANAEMLSLKQTLADMKPASTKINIDTAEKADQAGQIRRNQKQEEQALVREEDNKKSYFSAQDNIMRMNTIQKAIENGELSNLNTTDFGKGLETLGARLGIDNNSAAIGNFIQSANQQLVDARKQFQGQGQVSDSETRLLGGTVLQPNDTMESVMSKINIFNQVYKRQQQMADLTNEWVKRFGSTAKKASNGMSFYDATTNLYKAHPLVSEADIKEKQQRELMDSQP